MNREEMISQAVAALGKKGFQVTTFLDSNTCFDIIARNSESTMLVKVYENIDAMRREQGEELKKLAQVLAASCMIVGRKTKVFEMENGTVYYRHDVPSITLSTFENLLDEKEPEAKYFKGRRIVGIDFEKVRKKREELQLSLQELADKVGIASETLYRFEQGASTTDETAKKLEHELHASVTRKIPVFGYRPEITKIDDVPDERLLEKVREIGIRMALFDHAPFNAFGEMERGMFISTGKGKFDIPKKAAELKKTSAATGSDSIIVTKEYRHRSVDGVPVIEESELGTISKPKDLRKLINERENDDGK